VSVLCLDPEPLMYHAEVLRRDGEEVGYLRAASYGHTLGGAVGLALVKGTLEGEWSVEINGRRYPAAVSLRPPYDPTNARIKA
jgi:4-methylaminobutanoate oxidase (formaldehyde-forming)